MTAALQAAPPSRASVQHALTVLRNEVLAMREVRRNLLNGADASLKGADRLHFVEANLREIREFQEAIRLLSEASR